MFDKRISIFTGHFGSGKTEVAVNYAIKLKEKEENVAIVDLDIVNPFFRTADVREKLEEKGIRVLLPRFVNTNVDVPSLPAEMNALFEDKKYKVVLDIGGDDLGAKAVSRYRSSLLEDDYELFFVINARRPLTDSVEGIITAINEIEESARLKVTSLVNNTNLLRETTIEDFMEGDALVRKVSEQLGIPIGFVSGLDCIMDAVGSYPENRKLILGKHLKLPWEV